MVCATCKAGVRELGGELQIVSSVAHGTTLTVRLPVDGPPVTEP